MPATDDGLIQEGKESHFRPVIPPAGKDPVGIGVGDSSCTFKAGGQRALRGELPSVHDQPFQGQFLVKGVTGCPIAHRRGAKACGRDPIFTPPSAPQMNSDQIEIIAIHLHEIDHLFFSAKVTVTVGMSTSSGLPGKLS